MEYLWSNIDKPSFPKAKGVYETDTLIIGGGIAGVLTAYQMNRLGMNYMLVEGGAIGGGMTRGTTAVVTAQHDTLYTDIDSQFDEQTAALYLKANLEAVEEFRRLADYIEFDFESKPSFMVARDAIDAKALKRETDFLNVHLGYNARFRKSTELPYRISGAVEFPDMAQMHPLKLLYRLAEGLNIYENTYIKGLEPGVAYADEAIIHADNIVVATHFPFVDGHGMYFMKLYQNRSFVIALDGAEELDGTYVDMGEGGIYLRNYGKLLLVGGGDHRTGKRIDGFRHVRNFAHEYYPRAKEVFAWAAQDCMSLDGIPYIGRYGRKAPNMYVASGFNEWGMTSSMIASKLIPDLILGRENQYAPVFDPARSILRKQLLVNLCETAVSMLTPSVKRCSHLGCALKWNESERTWDCPCHGSRFDEHGELITNPAKKNASFYD